MSFFSRILGRKTQEPKTQSPFAVNTDSDSDVGEIRSPQGSIDVGNFDAAGVNSRQRRTTCSINAATAGKFRHRSIDARPSLSIEATGMHAKFSHLTLLHRGGNATIYRALQRRTGTHVTLKAYPQEAHALAHREADLLRRCAGLPGVVRLLEQFEEMFVMYNVLEGCQGGTLIEWVARKGGRLPEVDVAVDVALPLLRILDGLQGPGVMHRDIKPEHIVRAPDGLKLVDFVAAADMSCDRLNTRAGTLEYMAPEVLAMPTQKDLAQHCAMAGITAEELPCYSTSADLWSLGCVLYEAISGCQPFLGETTEEMVHLQMCCLDKGMDKGMDKSLSQPAGKTRRRSQVLKMELANEEAEKDLAAAVALALGSTADSHLYNPKAGNLPNGISGPSKAGSSSASMPAAAAAVAPAPAPAPVEAAPAPAPAAAAATPAPAPAAAADSEPGSSSAAARGFSLHTGQALPTHAPISTENIGTAVAGGQFLLKHSALVEQSISAAQQVEHAAAAKHKTEIEVVHGFDQATAAPDIFAKHMFSPLCISFLRCLLNWEAHKRVEARELMQHPWIQQAVARRAGRTSFSIPRSQPGTPRTAAAVELGQYESESPTARQVPLRRSMTWSEARSEEFSPQGGVRSSQSNAPSLAGHSLLVKAN